MKTCGFEMIMVIVNAGFSGEVVAIAKTLGAKGGTVMHARGTANPEAEKIFQITINPEKDLVMLVVKDEIKDKIMKEIYDKVGIGTDAGAVAFSIPVTDHVGLK